MFCVRFFLFIKRYSYAMIFCCNNWVKMHLSTSFVRYRSSMRNHLPLIQKYIFHSCFSVCCFCCCWETEIMKLISMIKCTVRVLCVSGHRNIYVGHMWWNIVYMIYSAKSMNWHLYKYSSIHIIENQKTPVSAHFRWRSPTFVGGHLAHRDI